MVTVLALRNVSGREGAVGKLDTKIAQYSTVQYNPLVLGEVSSCLVVEVCT